MEQSKSISAPQNRIHVLDALRGFALLGVILIHMLQHFGVFSGIRPEQPLFPALDEMIQWASRNIIMGKFINIFAFLFGLSFFIQMDRASQKGVDFRGRFVWRMVVLFAIGMVGNSFFTADILPIYAAFGVIMVLLFPLKNKLLILIALLLLIGTPRIVKNSYDQMVPTEQTQQAAAPQRTAPRAAAPPKPSYLNSAKQYLTTGFQGKLNYQFGINGRGYVTLALFILGLVVGRIRFFNRLETHKKQNTLLFIGLVVATCIVGFIPTQEVSFRTLMGGGPLSPAILASMALKDIHTVLFSASMALGFILLFQAIRFGSWLIPFGRMGLTNYTMQSILGGTMFAMWGFGSFFGSLGTTEVFAIGLLFYTIQVVVSRYWMNSFLYGPMEWLWRSATFFKLQPFKKRDK